MIILQTLHARQQAKGYLDQDDLRRVAQECGTSLHRVEELVSFFPHFRKQPPPRVSVRICRDMSCHLRGSVAMCDAISQWADAQYPARVEVCGVSCLGRCDRAVATQINEQLFVGRSKDEVQRIVQALWEGQSVEADSDTEWLERRSKVWDIDIYAGSCDYRLVRWYLQEPQPERILGDADCQGPLERAGLLGMGGAGGRAFKKWQEVFRAKANTKYVVCNADESEPGTFKDRDLLLKTPYLPIEGMIVAGLALQASRGWIYLRHEYPEQIAAVEREIERARDMNMLGADIAGSGMSFDLEVFVSPGNYICGEQTALIEAMEDKRAEPRIRPPELQTNGLWGQPTLLNNVETFAWVPRILVDSGQWFSQQARTASPWIDAKSRPQMTGKRFFSISGDVRSPGVFEVPTGITLGELIDDYCGGLAAGKELLAVATSGPSGGILPAWIPRDKLLQLNPRFPMPDGVTGLPLRNLPLDIHVSRASGIMIGAGLVIYGTGCDIVAEAVANSRFFRNESCGKCVPCRIGSQKITQLGEELLAGRVSADTLPVLNEQVHALSEAMSEASICGLGQVASRPMQSLLQFFPEEVQRAIGRDGEPS